MISIYLDANIFILAFEGSSAEGAYIWAVLDAVEAGEFTAKTSQITLSEILPGALMRGQNDLAAMYDDLFRSKSIFEPLAITLDVLSEAAKVRADRASIQLPDAIHLATARLSRCAAFLTADRRLLSVADLVTFKPDATCLAGLRNLSS